MVLAGSRHHSTSYRRLGVTSGNPAVPAKMKCHSLAGVWNTQNLRCVSSLVPLLVAAWLLLLPAGAIILQEGNPLELRPPSGQTGLYFGFSLAHYTNNSQRWLLVGAPRSNISSPDVINSGGLYQCPLSETTGTHECDEVNVDVTIDAPYAVWAKSNNSEQGLGFSLASSDKEIVVCAPQWYATKSIYNKLSHIPAGMCFAAKSPAYKFEFFSPPFKADNTSQISFLTTGYCQFGMSATYVKGQDTFAVGAPGCWGWQGDTWEVELDSKSSRHLGTLQSEDLDLKPNQWELYYLYMGYSVASLEFGGNTAILSSIPRTIWPEDISANTSFGPTILVLAQNPNNEGTLIVKQRISPSEATASEVSFSFFGYSLATLDVNGDGLEDLVVGAPLYQQPADQNNGAAEEYDHGAIFVYMQTASESHDNKEKIYQMKEEENAPQRIGKEPFGRFGSCVAAVGDLDGDGYEDLAVGAPFRAVSEGGTGTGAVYIYMGSHSGLEKDSLQTIKAAANQYGFGSSIAPRLQIVEGKGYDVAVGIYDSDKVLVFKSKEVVKVTWNLTFSGPIDLGENSCGCAQYGALCPCVEAIACLMYQRRFNKFEDNVELEFNITLATASSNELTFANGETEIQITVKVKEGEESCTAQTVMAKPGKEEIRSYEFTAELSLAKEENDVILDRHSVLKKNEHLNVFIHCASGDVSGCKSNIILHHEVLAPYIYASQAMKIKFNVRNQGETAYDSRLIIKSVDAFNIMGSDTNETVVCDKNGNKEIECKMGNLGNNSEETFILHLTPSKESLESTSVASHGPVFNMTAKVETVSNVSNPDTTVTDIQVDIIVSNSLELLKKVPEPSIVYFNSSSYYKSPEDAEKEEELGPEIKHKYSILNSNDFSIYGAYLTIHWPLTIAGKYFLYLMEEPELSGMDQKCQYTNGEVNPLSLATKPKRVIRSPEGQSEGLKTSALTMGIGSKHPEYMTIICHIGEFRGGNKEVTVELRSRLVLRTLVELEVGTSVKNASSFADLHITKMPFNVAPPEASHTGIVTEISYKDAIPDIKVPVWLYIVSLLGGLLVLGIIVIIMWKCGFFKRKRMEAADKMKGNQEQQKETEQEEAKLTEEQEEEIVQTPLSPMLQETESASDDFVFQDNMARYDHA